PGRIAEILQTVAQGKIERPDPVLRPFVDRIEPVVYVIITGPALAHTEDNDPVATPRVLAVVNRPHDPCAKPLDEIISEAVKADLIDHPLGVIEYAGGDAGVDMAEVRHIAEGGGIQFLVRGGVEAGPVAGKNATLGGEPRPMFLLKDRVELLLVGAVVVVEDQVGVDLHIPLV